MSNNYVIQNLEHGVSDSTTPSSNQFYIDNTQIYINSAYNSNPWNNDAVVISLEEVLRLLCEAEQIEYDPAMLEYCRNFSYEFSTGIDKVKERYNQYKNDVYYKKVERLVLEPDEA
jgi:hypothetical protein